MTAWLLALVALLISLPTKVLAAKGGSVVTEAVSVGSVRVWSGPVSVPE